MPNEDPASQIWSHLADTLHTSMRGIRVVRASKEYPICLGHSDIMHLVGCRHFYQKWALAESTGLTQAEQQNFFPTACNFVAS